VSSSVNDNTLYTYDAAGARLARTITIGTEAATHYYYSGPFMYLNNDLKCIFTPEGRVVALNDSPGVLSCFEYNLKDHLGNTRVTFTGHSNGKPEVNQITSYDPYGLVTSQTSYYTTGAFANKQLYNGKELQDDALAGTKINWYDYGARMYDPELGRWHTPDPLAEKYPSSSPYVYVSDNPLKYIDPDGREKIIAVNPNSPKNIAIINAAKKYTNDGAIHIWAHGGPNLISVFDGKSNVPISSATDFQNFLSKNSIIWQTKAENQQTTIILHSCETGKDVGDKASIAREISKELSNTTVIAPSENVVVNTDGTEGGTYSTKPMTDNNGKVMTNSNGEVIKVVDKEGVWLKLSAGKTIDSRPGSESPRNKP
jgi:RHS repeat-associated protein